MPPSSDLQPSSSDREADLQETLGRRPRWKGETQMWIFIAPGTELKGLDSVQTGPDTSQM